METSSLKVIFRNVAVAGDEEALAVARAKQNGVRGLRDKGTWGSGSKRVDRSRVQAKAGFRERDTSAVQGLAGAFSAMTPGGYL